MKRVAVRNLRLCTKDCLCLYVCPTGATDTENSVIDVDKCLGCGVCADVCPDRIISMENGRPAWNADSCTLCLACLHRCPRTAIDLGESTMGKRRYVNPKTDMPVGPI